MAFLYMLLVKTVAEAKIEESAEDIEAADIMPIPTQATACGVRCWSDRGKMKL